MSAQAVKDELLKIWPDGDKCSHIHARTAFKLLDEMIGGKEEQCRIFHCVPKEQDENKPLQPIPQR